MNPLLASEGLGEGEEQHGTGEAVTTPPKGDAIEIDRFFFVSLDMMCISNPEGYLLRINPAWTVILGWSEQELLSKPFLEFVHPDDFERTRLRVERAPDIAVSTIQENRYAHEDGSWRTIAWRSVKVENGLLYSTGRDVTEQRLTEANLLAARDAAEKANAAKSEFLSRMSHELRTPMNAVLGYAQLLNLKYEDPGIKQASQAIMKGGKHLLQLINEILDLSRIETGNLGISIEPVELAEVISQVVILLAQAAKEAGVELTHSNDSEGIYVLADRQRLVQVLMNIIGNAIKFNHPGGSVEVRSQALGSDFQRVEVTDTGPGIEPESQPLLFQPFQRFGNHGIDGTGLGLAVSERFVSLMGGNIGLAHSSPSGSSFFIELKRGQPPELLIATPEDLNLKLPATASRGKVLYVEDNLSNVGLVETLLEDWKGVELLSAAEGRLGVELAVNHKPNMILLDVHLPDLSGDKVLRELKANSATRDIPVVMLSADVTPRQIKASMALGAEEYLTKPIDIVRLFDILNMYLPAAR